MSWELGVPDSDSMTLDDDDETKTVLVPGPNKSTRQKKDQFNSSIQLLIS